MTHSESDTRSKLIDPSIKESGWLESNIVREYYFTDGRKLIGGKRGKRYFVDYLLTYKNTNLAIIEAKAESKDPLDGLQQSINYAQRLKIDFVYATNGHKIYEHSLVEGKGSFIENYPNPEAKDENDGTPSTEPPEDYLELLIGVLVGEFYNKEDGLREIWSNPTNRKDLLNKLKEMNIDEAQLGDLKVIFEAEDSDIYDVLAHLCFNFNIKTRAERVLHVEDSEFIEKLHNEKAKSFIEFILERYKKDGVKELDEDKLGKLVDLSGLGSVREVAQNFGGISQMRDEYFELQREIYR